MKLAERGYFISVCGIGIGILLASLGTVAVVRVGMLELLLLLLALVASWLRIKFDPTGHITLAPLIVFATLLLAEPWVAIIAAALSALVGSKIFARNSWAQSLIEMGEEAISVLIAVVLAMRISGALAVTVSARVLAFSVAVMAYSVVRLILAALGSNLASGVGILAFIFGAGRYAMMHFLFLGLAAQVLAYLYSSVGFLALPLAMVALVELYYPAKLFSDQRDVLYASLAAIAQAVDLKDVYTGRHARDVSQIGVRIARTMHLPETEVGKVRIAALLHDVGKIGVSGNIIRKPSKLDSEEESKMRQHPVIGADIMQPVELLAEAAELVRHHHEHLDGSGYPAGLRGDEIPLGSRIVLVADAFNAMTTDRPYRRGRSRKEALQVLKEHSGRQFDPNVVKALESIIDLA